MAEYVYDYNGMRMIKKNYANGTLSNTVYSWTDSFETKETNGGGSSSVSVSNLTSGTDNDNNSTATTSSVTPGSNKLELLSVVSRTNISVDPNQPTITGNGLIWVAIDSSVFDDTSTSRKRVTLFRAMGGSPSSGTIAIDFGGQNQTHVMWSLDEASGIDTSGANGSGAIVQSAKDFNGNTQESSFAVNLNGFSSANNATFGAWGGGDGNATSTAGGGFTKYGSQTVSGGPNLTTEFRNDNDTSVDLSWSIGQFEKGGIAVELKAGSGEGSTETTVYYFANNELIAKKNNDGSRYYVHNDHLGSSSVLTNSGGTLVEATTYDPWGEVLSGGTASKFQYTGQEMDAETGLNYYNARYYNSDIRRFTQPDDIIQDVYSPQILNRYSYVNNNPLRYTDPTGHVGQNTNVGGPQTLGLNVDLYSDKLGWVTGSNKQIQNKNNKQQPSKESPITTYLKDVKNNGHVDIGISTGRLLTGSGGIKIDKQGTTQYIGAKAGTEVKYDFRVGATVLLSRQSVKQHSVNNSFTASFGLAAQVNIDTKDPFNPDKWRLEGIGIGCCGIDIGPEYTGRKYLYPNSQVPPVYSLPLKEVYYGK